MTDSYLDNILCKGFRRQGRQPCRLLKGKTMQLDMTKGSPFKLIIKFIIPVVLGNLFQQFYSMVDTIIVGRCVGMDALAAVGATGTISFLILGFALGLTSGFTVLTAQKFGAGDIKGMKLSVTNALMLSFLVSVIMTIVSVLGMRRLLRVMNTPANIFEMSYDYIIIIVGGMFFTILYNIMASLLRAVGNSKAPFYFLVLSACLNIVLDLVLIKKFSMGVKGAAYATIISQAVSGVLCVLYSVKKVDILVPGKEERRGDSQCIKNQLSVGIPMALQFSITALGTMIAQAALNLFGSTVMASYTAANKACQFATLPYGAMGATMATYCAQNRGVNDIERIKKGVRISGIISAVYSLLIYAVAMLTLSPLMRLFFDASENVDFGEVLGYGRTYMLVAGTCFVPLGLIFIYRNAMQGCGYSFLAMLGGVVELISRWVIATVATKLHSYVGVCWADPATWLVTGIFLMFSYYYTLNVMRKRKLAFEAGRG